MYLSVLVPYYKSPEKLYTFLSNFNRIDYARDKFEVIIINNCNTPPKININVNFTLRIINENKPGAYSARNKGILSARGAILAFTDIDCLPRVDWLKQASACFEGDQKIERLMGEIYVYPINSFFSLGWIVDSTTAFVQKLNFKKSVSPTANLFVKKEVFKRVGLFDDSLYSGGDFEWSKRATKRGVNLEYSEDTVVLHPSRCLLDSYKKTKRVIGGLFVEFARNKQLMSLLIIRALPPIKYGYQLVSIGRPLYKVIIAIPIVWLINLICLFEILRLKLGGKPNRV